MNNRGLTNRTAISNAINTDLLNQLKKLSKTTQIPLSKLLDNAIKLLLDSYKTTN